MKKKLLVFLLVATVVLGVLGLNAFAGTEESTPATPVATALWTQSGSVTVNGSASEANWVFDSWIRGGSGAPEGRFAKLWNGTDLYLAVKTDGATSLKATLNTKVINVTLGASPVADVAGVTVKQSGNILEMKVPFASIGFVMHGYDQQMPLALELTNASGSAKFDGKLTFGGEYKIQPTGATLEHNTYDFHANKFGYTQGSGVTAVNPATGVSLQNALAQAKTSGQIGAEQVTVGGTAGYHLWNKYQEGKTNHLLQYSRVVLSGLGTLSGWSAGTMLDFDLQIADMPECVDPAQYLGGLFVANPGYSPAGFSIALGRTNKVDELGITISNVKGRGLCLYVMTGDSKYDIIPLNRQVSDETMHVSIRYGLDYAVDVVIDDVAVYHNDQIKFGSNGYFGGDTVMLSVWHPSYYAGNTSSYIGSNYIPLNSGYDSDVTVSNIKMGMFYEGDQLEELTFDKIKGDNSEPTSISGNLSLPTTLTDPNGRYSANLTWSSTPAGYISATGEVTSPEAQTDVVLTATVAGSNPAITKKFNLTLVMPPIDAWRADSVTVDGNLDEYYDFARGYTFALEAGKPSGAVATRWTKDTLYVGAKYENASFLAMQIGAKIIYVDLVNKTVTNDAGAAITGVSVSVGAGTVELALPLSYLNLQVKKDTAVSMGVILANDSAEIGKNLLLGFFGVPEKAELSWVKNNGITVNGTLTEKAWQLDHITTGHAGTAAGAVGAVWNNRDLYLAINADSATALKVMVEDQIVEIADLNNVPASSGVATAIAKSGNTVEMKIPFGDFYGLYNYGQSIDIAVELTNSNGVSGFAGEMTFVSRENLTALNSVTFVHNTHDFHSNKFGYTQGSGKTAVNPATGVSLQDALTLAQASGQVGAETITENGINTYHIWNKYQEGKQNHMVQFNQVNVTNFGNLTELTDTVVLDFDVQIADLAEMKNPTAYFGVNAAYSPAGLQIAMVKVNKSSELSVTICNVAGKGLVLYIMKDSDRQLYDQVVLDRQVGDAFHMAVRYGNDRTTTIFVDGKQVYHNENMPEVSNGMIGDNSINFILWNPGYVSGDNNSYINSNYVPLNDGYNSDVYVSNVKLGTVTCDDLWKLLTFDTIKNRNINPDLIMTDLTLPAALTDGRLSVPLTWASSKPEAISTTGVVNTDYEGNVTLTASLGTTSRQLRVNVAMSVLDAWKGSAYTEGRGYTFASAGKPQGEVNARWDDTNLYLQLENTNASKVTVVLNNKSYSANVSSGAAEIKVPLADLNLGKITSASALATSVNLTNDAGSITKKLQLSFFGAPVVTATNWEPSVTVDGNATEGAWKFYHQATGRPGSPEGKVAALWSEKNLYLAVKTEDTSKLHVTVNGKKATIDMATLAVTGMTGVTVKKSGNTVELKIPFASFDFNLYNYGQTVAALVEFEGEIATSGFAADLSFTSLAHVSTSGKTTIGANQPGESMYGPASNVTNAMSSGQIGGTVNQNADGGYDYRMWNIYQEGKQNYSAQRVYFGGTNENDLVTDGIVSVEFDVRIDDMPVYKDPASGKIVWRKYQPAGLGIMLGRDIENEEIDLSISHTAEGLVLYVSYSTKGTAYGEGSVMYDGPYKLNKTLGETFHMNLHYTEEGELAVYVDDVLIYAFKDVGENYSAHGAKVLCFNLWSACYNADLTSDILDVNSAPINADANSDVTVSNLKIGKVSCYDLRDNLTFDDFKGGNGSADMVSKNLALPTTISDGNKLTTSLVWSSSNTKVISNSGVVTTQDKDMKVTMTAKLGGSAQIVKSFDLAVVLPSVDAWRTTSANVNGTLAEYHDFARGYTFPEGAVNGAIAARWTKNTLYIGAKTDADTMTIVVGGKTITANISKKTVSGVSGASIAVGSGTVELGIPMSQLKLGTISQGTVKPLSVTFSKGSTKVQKQLNLNFFGAYETSHASWNDGTIAIDGILDEDWLMYTETTGRIGTPEGVIGKMWNGTDLFVAVDTDGASKLYVTLNGKTLTIDLTTTLVASGAITQIAKSGDIVEMKISFKDFFTLVNYGQVIDIAIELENAVGASGFDGGFEFTSREHLGALNKPGLQQTQQPSDFLYGPLENAKLAYASGQAGYVSTVDENGRYTYHMWNKYLPGQKNYSMQRVYTSFDMEEIINGQTGTLTVDFDVRIDDMPVYLEPANGYSFYRGYQANGLGIYVGRSIEGEELNLVITNTTDGLALLVGYGPFTQDYGNGTVRWDGPYKINETMGQEFHVMLHYSEKGELAVYIDDVMVYALKDVGQDFNGINNSGLIFSLWSPYYRDDEERPAGIDKFLNPDSSPKNSDYDIDATISDVRIGKSSGTNILDLITYDTIKGNNGDSDSVVSNLTLPSSISDGKISAKLSWTSSNRGAITNGGTVYSQDVRTPVNMTVSLVGAKPAITKVFPMTVVMPFVDTWQTNFAKIDGDLGEYYGQTRGYTFASASGKPSGSVAAGWSKDRARLYYAIKYNNTTKITITMGSRVIVVDLKAQTLSGVKNSQLKLGEKNTVEIAIPLDQVRITDARNNMLYDISVKLENEKSSVSKNLTLAFYGQPSTALATWDDKTVVLDGVADEKSWLLYSLIEGRPGTPEGSFGKLWNGSDLYLAVDTDGAKKLSLTIGEKTMNVDLTKATPTVSGMSNVKVAKQGDIVEMKIPFKSFGFTLHNYTETISMKLELSNAAGTSGFYGMLQFSSRKVEFNDSKGGQEAKNIIDWDWSVQEDVAKAEATGQIGYTIEPTEQGGYSYHMWNIYQEGKQNYAVQRIFTGICEADMQELIKITGNITVDFDLRIDDMPEYKDPTAAYTFHRTYQPNGFGVWFGRNLPGEEVSLVITNTKDGLALFVGSGPFDNTYGSGTVQWDGPYYIGKELGEQFHVSIHQTMKGEVQVYIDDAVLFAFKDMGADFGLGTNGMIFSLWSPKYAEKYNDTYVSKEATPLNSDYNTDLYVSNLQIGTTTCYDLFEYLDFDYIKGNNGDETNVITDLILPSKLTDGRLSVALTWESKKPEVVSEKGKVTTQNKDTTVILRANMTGTDPVQYKELEVSVALPPVDSWYNASVAMDGKATEYHNFERGYDFVKVSGKPTGSVGAAWDDEMMYVGIKHNGADSIKIKIEGKTLKADLAKGTVSGINGAKIAVGDGIVELAIPKNILKERAIKEDRVDMVVTLIKGENETEKGLRMSFYGKTQDGIVGFGGDMVVDGTISETAYQLYGQTKGRPGTPEGLVGKVWSGKNLYLAMFVDDAKTLKLTLNGKTATVNIGSMSTSGNLISKIAKGEYTYYDEKEEQLVKGTLIEMEIPFEKFGFDMYAYGLTADMSVELVSPAGIAAYNTKMAFTNKVAKNYLNELPEIKGNNAHSGQVEPITAKMTAGSAGGLQTDFDYSRFSYRLWNVYDENNWGYVQRLESSQYVAHGIYEPNYVPEGDYFFEFDVRVDKMISPSENFEHSVTNYGCNGVCFWVDRGIKGQEMLCGISGRKEEGLIFVVRVPESTEQLWFPINRELHEMFHVTVQWKDNGDLTVYIDDEKLCDVPAGALGTRSKNTYAYSGSITMNLLCESSWSKLTNDDQSIDVTISNILISSAAESDLLQYLNFEDFRGENRRINEVWKDMPLPKTVTDGVVTADVVWESSNPSVISIANGVAKVTPQDEDTKVTLTVRMKGNQEILRTFEITVTCPIVDAKLIETAKKDDASLSTYAKQVAYKLSDGSTVAAQWDKTNIYLGVAHKGADTVNLTFGDKKISVNLANKTVTGIEGGKVVVSGSKAEITLPRSALGITIADYHATERFTLELAKSGKAMATKVLKLEFVGYESVADEYLNSKALKDFVASIKTVTEDVVLPQTYQSQFVDASANLTWESDTVRVMDNNGKIVRPAKVDAKIRLSLLVDGEKIGVYEVIVKALGTPDLQSATKVQVPFGKDVKIDGSISEQGWSMNHNLVNSKAVVGQMGAQWDTQYLYLAFQYEKAKALSIEIEGKTANININSVSVSGDLKIAQIKKGTYLELKIPMKEVGLENIIDYGDTLKVKVMLDDGVFDGTFVLSSLQWMATDNPEHRYAKNEWAMNGDNASYTNTAEGYYLYEEYLPEGNNIAASDYGLGLVNGTIDGQEIFKFMEDSGKVGLYAEFDFQAMAMPVYTGSEKLQGANQFISNNGFTWQIGGYANKVEATSEWISAGMYMSKSGMVLMIRVGKSAFYSVPLGKQVGDMFRIGMAWTTDDTLHVYVDGERVYTLEDAVNFGTTQSAGGINFRFTRSEHAAACDSDSVRINVSNVALGYYYGDCILEDIDFKDIQNRNMNYAAVTSDLNLMSEYVNPQISSGKLTWSSSDPAVAPDGTVTRPEDKSYALTRLTVTNELGHTNEIITAVKGLKELDDILYVKDDYDVVHGAGQKYTQAFLMFDEENVSVIKDQKETKQFSVVKLTDVDHENRLYEDFLTLWVSEDNATYTEVKDFKFYQNGNETYLYGFEAEGRYVKVHCTHLGDNDGMSEMFFPEMIDVYYEEIFGDSGASFGTKKTVTVKNTESIDKVDWPWTFTSSELGIVSLAEDMADVRIFLGDELLYHYVEDGKITVRIPEVKAGNSVKLKVLSGNADAMNISNKEFVYEAIYGTREFMKNTTDTQKEFYNVRCMMTLEDGTIVATNRANSAWDEKRVDCRVWCYSTDNGRTWVEMGVAEDFLVGPASGGFVYDPYANILYSFGYGGDPRGEGFDRLGMCKLDLNNGIENAKWEFSAIITGDLPSAINYNHGTTLSCYDGEGPNVDMIVAYAASGDTEEDKMALYTRVSYTTDAGATWIVSDSKITIPDIEFGFESGLSETTTLELDDGTIILLSRYQDLESYSFAYSYSTDHGVTWADGVPSNVYAPNTQPMFHETEAEFDLITWAGNNIEGGESYQRWPLNLGIPEVEEDYSNMKPSAVQNAYQRTYYWNVRDDKSGNTRNTNHYLTHTTDGALLIDMYLQYSIHTRYLFRLDDYQDYVTKTKGSYDSFEKGSTKYEGWADYVGMSETYKGISTEGDYSMRLFGSSVRSVPYFRNGSVSFDLNWNSGTEFKLEAATTFSRKYMEGSPVGFVVDHSGNLLDGYGNDTGIDLADGWNTVEMTMDLPNNVAKISINGAEPVDLKVDTTIGDYVTYVTLHSDAYVYVDDFTQMGEMDDFWPEAEAQNAEGFDTTAILLVALPLLVIAVAVWVIRKKKTQKPVSDQETTENA